MGSYSVNNKASFPQLLVPSALQSTNLLSGISSSKKPWHERYRDLYGNGTSSVESRSCLHQHLAASSDFNAVSKFRALSKSLTAMARLGTGLTSNYMIGSINYFQFSLDRTHSTSKCLLIPDAALLICKGDLIRVKTMLVSEETLVVRRPQNKTGTGKIVVGRHCSRKWPAFSTPPWWLNILINMQIPGPSFETVIVGFHLAASARKWL